MFQIPSRSNELSTLYSNKMLAMLLLGVPQLAIGIVILPVMEPSHDGISAGLFYTLLVGIPLTSIVLLLINRSIHRLSRYETFRELYEAYRSNPTQKAGQELYSHYLSFEKANSLEDKIMDSAILSVVAPKH